MVAAQRAGSPLYQQQESPPELFPEANPAGPIDPMSRAAAASPQIPTANGNANGLQGDHSKEREADVAIDIGDTSKNAAAYSLPTTSSMHPDNAPARPPFWKDPFGWVLRPRKISKHQRMVLIFFGRVGWCAKAIIYSIIGGLCCKSSVQGRNGSASASPQGAFILIGNIDVGVPLLVVSAVVLSPTCNAMQGAFILIGNNDVGVPLLVVLAVMLALYAGWRFWEGIIGAGTDANVGKAKNFFRYRLSPMVSGAVYLAYMGYILSLLAKNRQQRLTADDNRAFPNSWRHSDGGKFGLAIIGIAFIAAFLAQIEMIFTKAFHREMRQNLNCFVKWTAYISGHIGFAGRAGTFLLVSILFFRTIEKDTGDETTIANALYQLQGNAGGRFALFLLGWGLIVYGLYATMCGLYIREFPTQPRSRNPIAPLEHARHLWNARREKRLQQRADMMRDTLGLEMNGAAATAVKPGAHGHSVTGANGHAASGSSDGTMTAATNSWAPSPTQLAHNQAAFPAMQQSPFAAPQHAGPDAVPSRVFVPPSSVAQV